jgi:hypothetical protein
MDYPGLRGELERFAYRCVLSPRLMNLLNIILEETTSLLSQSAASATEAHIHIEVPERKGEAQVEIRWKGKPANILEEADEYSSSLIHHVCPNVVYEESGEWNCIRGNVRDTK